MVVILYSELYCELKLNDFRRPFVLFSGEDEQSAQLITSWEDDRVSEAVQNGCVAINVDAKR